MTEPPGLLIRSGEPFTTGASQYLDAYPGREEPLARIYVQIQPAGVPFGFLALLDTGGHYCVLNEEAAHLTRMHLTSSVGQVDLQTAYGSVRGELYIHKITLIADVGEPLDIESTVFIPPDWRGPSFLGYTGAPDRMRFAVDPEANRFYFGPLG